jgi:hypothetical protein
LRRPDIEVAVGGIGQRLRRGRRAVVENVGGAVADPVCQAAVTGSDCSLIESGPPKRKDQNYELHDLMFRPRNSFIRI